MTRDRDGALHDKLPALDERLKHVYVESHGSNPVIKTKRKLPENTSKVRTVVCMKVTIYLWVCLRVVFSCK